MTVTSLLTRGTDLRYHGGGGYSFSPESILLMLLLVSGFAADFVGVIGGILFVLE